MPPGDSDAERFSGLGESPRKPGRINERATAAIPDSGKVGRRVDLCPHLAGVEDVRAARLQPLDLVGLGRNRQRAAALEVACDAVPVEGCLDLVEVLRAKVVKPAGFCGEQGLSVGLAVGEAGRAEPPVPAAGRGGDPVAFDQHDLPARVSFLGQQSRPQPGKPAADHRQSGVRGRRQRRAGGGAVRPIEPERPRRGIRP